MDTLHRTSIFLNVADKKKLAVLGRVRGLAPAQLVRIAIQEYLRRELKKT